VRARRRERGQAAVELVLVLPFLMLLLLLVVQVGLVVRGRVLVTEAAREAARAAAVDARPGAATAAAAGSTTLDPRRLQVRVQARGSAGEPVRVEVSYDMPTDVPLVGVLVPDVTLTATATMRVEVAKGTNGLNANGRGPPSNLFRAPWTPSSPPSPRS
jgi:Flp pilus assembly protein TadG